MGPKDPTQISREVIYAVLGSNTDSEIFLGECGFTSLLAFLDKGTDNLPKVIAAATRMRLLKAIHTFEVDRERKGLKTTAMDVLRFLNTHITFALMSPIGSLFGEDTVEPNSTNPFKSATASCINAELRRIHQELYLSSLDTPGEELLHECVHMLRTVISAIPDAPFVIKPLLKRYDTLIEEAANARP